MKRNLLRVILILMSLLPISVFCFADNGDVHIIGHVENKNTKELLAGISITIKGTEIGTFTDATGHYMIKNIKPGKYIITAYGIGFKKQEKLMDVSSAESAEADFEMEEDNMLLESIVVSANKNTTNRREAPSIVNVISPKFFERTNSVCLSQALNYQPGLRVETDCQNCGYQQVRINGMDGSYSQVLIDGRPIFNSLQSVYGIEQVPANMVERVEVIRGGGSALYGSNAIGGIVNIITKDPDRNSATVENNTSFVGCKTQDITTSFNASVISDDNAAGVVVFGSVRNRNPYDANGDDFSEITKLDSRNIGVKSYYKTGAYGKLTVEYHSLYEFRRGGNKFNLPPHCADIAEQAQHKINTGGVKYDLFSRNGSGHTVLYTSGQIVSRDNYAGAQRDTNAYGRTNNNTFVAGMQYSYDFEKIVFMPSQFTAGAEYINDKLHDEILGYDRIIDQTIGSFGSFLQNEWKNKEWSILIGARIDKNSQIHNPIISPRINLRYNPNDIFSFRASFSSGFRAPQIYDEDLHGSAIGGNNVFVKNADNLKTEKSHSISCSADFNKKIGGASVEIMTEGFYTNLKNVFYLREIGKDASGTLLMERNNGSGATVAGINTECKVAFSAALQFQFGYTFQHSRYKQSQTWSDDSSVKAEKKMFRSPDSYGYITAYYQLVKSVEIAIDGTYTGSMIVQHYAGYILNDCQKTTKDFFDCGVKFSYSCKLKRLAEIKLSIGLKNIFDSFQTDFDKGQYRDSKYIYGPQLPRTLVFGVKIGI
ncbi:MAG TPA: TonB-dependent receptor [Candidatus Egerieousia sp.]|nr:TonB-dependent receptor [Candidatus Egerieousia sp.]HPT06407.1 TonB-dependent receptor [Candidatus Egerieousia sp.]